MDKELPARQLELYRSIDEFLWREWDPIGVNDVAEARGEYQGYLSQILKLALAGDRMELAKYLNWAVNEQMGFGSSVNEQLRFADRILQLKAGIIGAANDT